MTNERYARADTSVTAQALHIVAAAPDAVMTGGSGTPGALPFIALAERGYKGQIYGTHALINPDFVRDRRRRCRGSDLPGGADRRGGSASGVRSDAKISTGVSSGLSEGQQRAGAGRVSVRMRSTAGWSCWIPPNALWRPAPSPARRSFVLRCATPSSSTKEVVGTHGVYNFKPGRNFGVDERALVLVKLVDGKWKLMQ